MPLIHLDALYWRPGWDPTPADEWRIKVQALMRGARWIMDGNYGGTLDMRFEACDTVVFLDLSRWLCLWRVVKRQLRHRGGVRAEMAPGCPERMTWEFIQWIWTYPARRRGSILARLAALQPRKEVHVLSSSPAVESFLARL